MLYLAMTAGEMERCPCLPPHVAWMACQFSSYDRGLSNLPRSLPKGSVITVSDQTPISDHDPKTVADQLLAMIQEFDPAGILLDFQRPGGQEMAKYLVNALPCPTAVSQDYAEALCCPVFLSPLALCKLPELSKWKGRDIWLDAPVCSQTVTVTKEGAQVSPLLPYTPPDGGFFHKKLSVRYKIKCLPDRAAFTLSRGPEEIKALKIPEITHIFCLFQEFSENNP